MHNLAKNCNSERKPRASSLSCVITNGGVKADLSRQTVFTDVGKLLVIVREDASTKLICGVAGGTAQQLETLCDVCRSQSSVPSTHIK